MHTISKRFELMAESLHRAEAGLEVNTRAYEEAPEPRRKLTLESLQEPSDYLDQLGGLRGAVDQGVQFLADRLLVLHRELMEIYSLTSSLRDERHAQPFQPFQTCQQPPFLPQGQPFHAPAPCPPPPCQPPSPCQSYQQEPCTQAYQELSPDGEEPMSRADSHGSQGGGLNPFGQSPEPAKQARNVRRTMVLNL